MTTYQCTVFVNVATDPSGYPLGFGGYDERHEIAEVPNLPLCVQADTAQRAASEVFTIGNRMSPDLAGREWPSDVRSVSVGDLIKLRAIPSGEQYFLAVERFGFRDLVEPTNPIVPLIGSNATSRTRAQCKHERTRTLPVGAPGVGTVTSCKDCGEIVSDDSRILSLWEVI